MIYDNVNNEKFFNALKALIVEHKIDKQIDTYAPHIVDFLGATLDNLSHFNAFRDPERGFKDYGN